MGQALLDLVNFVSSAKEHSQEGGEGYQAHPKFQQLSKLAGK